MDGRVGTVNFDDNNNLFVHFNPKMPIDASTNENYTALSMCQIEVAIEQTEVYDNVLDMEKGYKMDQDDKKKAYQPMTRGGKQSRHLVVIGCQKMADTGKLLTAVTSISNIIGIMLVHLCYEAAGARFLYKKYK